MPPMPIMEALLGLRARLPGTLMPRVPLAAPAACFVRGLNFTVPQDFSESWLAGLIKLALAALLLVWGPSAAATLILKPRSSAVGTCSVLLLRTWSGAPVDATATWKPTFFGASMLMLVLAELVLADATLIWGASLSLALEAAFSLAGSKTSTGCRPTSLLSKPQQASQELSCVKAMAQCQSFAFGSCSTRTSAATSQTETCMSSPPEARKLESAVQARHLMPAAHPRSEAFSKFSSTRSVARMRFSPPTARSFPDGEKAVA
mmetsp:Transcript_109230/g.341736  ORF Transcript_109230/g.341736 Transcript_109230/m.341736 type:complete len:262 (-) Transcript_109230:612-1397(-)